MFGAGKGSEQRTGNSRPLRLLITGGGTGGHVYPGLAVAEHLQRCEEDIEIRFAGTRHGIEARIVPRAGFPLYSVPASGLRGLGPVGLVKFLVNFCVGFFQSLALLLAWRPAFVLGTGGYVSAPVIAAARVLRIRCAVQEQNAMPGSTNRLVGRWAERIYLGFASAAAFFAEERCLMTGNPVRAAFTDPDTTVPGRDETPPQASVSTGQKAFKLLVFGGSGGSRTLNRAVAACAEHWRERPRLTVWAQTGETDCQNVTDAFTEGFGKRVTVAPFIYGMPAALAWADLVVCRAGAMTLAELQMVGRPAVLVPFPYATDDHQLRNAQDYAAAGAARVLKDADCDGDSLLRVVDELLGDPEQLARMGQAAVACARPQAAQMIAEDLLQLMGRSRPGDVAEATDVS